YNQTSITGSSVKVGENLVTNRSYDRPIPTNEGGDVDNIGRFVCGSAYEGAGGPEDKTTHVYQHNPGGIDGATVRGRGKDPRELERAALLRDDNVLPANQGRRRAWARARWEGRGVGTRPTAG
ncbi:uncharacterized protein P884DRAFT_316977, partial [Thermothelomyces heterothallicus CBS 202.75]|uniref:uncharacterized protein n=1 Tax=Thermothelomyces heterothallicus CBS 202.75 TaxID=1149848 RepID=UPI0037445D83